MRFACDTKLVGTDYTLEDGTTGGTWAGAVGRQEPDKV